MKTNEKLKKSTSQLQVSHKTHASDKSTQTIHRFFSKVEQTNTCWIWTGARNQYGYGMFLVKRGKTRGAHRFSFETFVGPIPEGHDVCHTCDVRNCVNPAHLWSGTTSENLRDCSAKGRHASMPNAPSKTGEPVFAEYKQMHPLMKRVS